MVLPWASVMSNEDDRSTSADCAGKETQYPAIVSVIVALLLSAILREVRLDLDDVYPYHTDLAVLNRDVGRIKHTRSSSCNWSKLRWH